MCNCVTEMNKMLAPHNTYLDRVSLLNFKTGKIRESIHISTAKRERKPGKVKVVLPTFCPFCGKRSAPKSRRVRARQPEGGGA